MSNTGNPEITPEPNTEKHVNCIKILPGGELFNITNHKFDEDWIRMNRDCVSGVALDLPEFWNHKRYRLTMMTKDTFEDADAENDCATYVYHQLRSSRFDASVIKGVAFLFNEDDSRKLDFTVQELQIILNLAK